MSTATISGLEVHDLTGVIFDAHLPSKLFRFETFTTIMPWLHVK